jgi:RHS repeat-associated protein
MHASVWLFESERRKLLAAGVAASLACALVAALLVFSDRSSPDAPRRPGLYATGPDQPSEPRVPTEVLGANETPPPLGPAIDVPIFPTAPEQPGPSPAPGAHVISPEAAAGATSFSRWTRNADDTVTVRLYLHPAFRRYHGEWQKIDTQIRATGDGDEPAAADGALRPVFFGSTPESLLRVELDQGDVRFAADGLDVSSPEVDPTTITYRDVATATDLRYGVSAAGIDQRIVLRSAAAPTEFHFRIDDPDGALGNVSASPEGFRFTRLIDSDVAIRLRWPDAYEERGIADAFPPTQPGSAAMKVEPVEGGFDVSVKVSSSWLEGKQFPIVLRPPIAFEDAFGKAQEAYGYLDPLHCPVEGCAGGWADATAAGSYVDATRVVPAVHSAYRFNLSPIPQGSVVKRSRFVVTSIGCLGDRFVDGQTACGGARQIEARPLKGAWDAAKGLTGLTSRVDTQVLDATAAPTSAGVEQAFDLTERTQDWMRGFVANSGLLLQAAQQQVPTTGGPEWQSSAESGSDPESGAMMLLTVVPAAPGFGLENWWTYTAQSVGPQATAYVNVANGNLVLQHTDAVPVQAHGDLAFVMRRTYNSQDHDTSLALPGSFGAGWRLNIGEAGDVTGLTAAGVDLTGESVASPIDPVLIDRDGTNHVFTHNTLTTKIDVSTVTGALLALAPRSLTAPGVKICVDQTYSPPLGVHLALWRYLRVATGTCASPSGMTVLGYAAERPDRVRQEFDATGRLISLADGNGNELRYRYSSHAGVLSIDDVWEPDACATPTDPSVAPCRRFHFTYSGNTIALTDTANRLTTYTFDTSTPKRLTSVTNPDGTTISYTYSQSAGCTGSPAVQLCSVTDLKGKKTTFSYATTAGVTHRKLVGLVDRRGTTSSFSYTDADSDEIAESVDVTKSGQRRSFSLIDGQGRVSQADVEDSATGATLKRTQSYWDLLDIGGCQQPEVPADVNSTIDNNLCRVIGRTLATSKAQNVVTNYLYNREGRTLLEQFENSPVDSITTWGYSTQYVKQSGSPTIVSDTASGSGVVTSGARPADYLFAISDLTEMLGPRGNAGGAVVSRFKTTYDVDDASTIDPNASRSASTTTCDTTSVPANSGNVCEQQSPNPTGSTTAAKTRYTYDGYGQRLAMKTPKAVAEGLSGQYGYTYYRDPADAAPDDLDLSQTAPSSGWLKAVTDPTGSFVAFAYDAYGHVVRTWDRNATDGTSISSYPGTIATPVTDDYTQELYATGSGSTPYASPWRYQRSSTNQLGNESTFAVDNNGNVTTLCPPRSNPGCTGGFETTQTYWDDDLLKSRAEPLPDGVSANAEQLVYDARGNLTSHQDRRGNYRAFAYNAADQLIEEHFSRTSDTDLLRPITPSCRVRNATDGPIPSGRWVCVRALQPDGLDDVVSTTDANGAQATSFFDGLRRRVIQQTPRNDGTFTNLKTQWIYDREGHVLDECSPREFTEGGSITCTATAEYGSHRGYNEAGLLKNATIYRDGAAKTSTFAYDADGNLASSADPRALDAGASAATFTTTHTYDLLDRRTATTVPRDATTSFTTTYRYNDSGDLTSVSRPGSTDSGAGTDGDLVVSGTGTDPHPASNPFVVPAGKQYSSATLTAGGFITGSGGVVDFKVLNTLSVCSTCGITVSGAGPAGGAPGSAGTPSGTAGGNGSGTAGGRGGAGGTLTGGGGGGGTHATNGGSGFGGGVGEGAGGSPGTPSYGSSSAPSTLGSGGGGGGGSLLGTGGSGGAGGGRIRILAGTMSIQGTVSAAGVNGGDAPSVLVGEPSGGGGGGSGGSIWLTAGSMTVTLANGLDASGGDGGHGGNGNYGGAGGIGRIKIEANSFSGAGTSVGSQGSLERTTAYSYDAAHRLLDTVEGSDNYDASQAGIFDQGTGANVRTRNFYDRDDHVIGRLLPRAFTSSIATPSTSPHLQRTDYDKGGRPTIAFSPRYDPTAASDLTDSTTQSTECPTGATPQAVAGVAEPTYAATTGVCRTIVDYNANGDRSKLHLPTEPGSANRYLALTYTDDRLVSKVEAPSPASDGARVDAATTAYDGEGRKTAVEDALNRTTTWSYTDDGLLEEIDEPDAGANLHITTFSYDAAGNQIKTTDAANKDWTNVVYSDGLVKDIADPLGNTTRYVYDSAGNPADVYSPSALSSADANNTANVPVRNAFFSDNLLKTMTEPVSPDGTERRRTTYGYDPAGLKLSQHSEMVNGSGTPISGQDGKTQRFAYDLAGRQRAQYGREGEAITTVHDAEGLPLSVTDDSGAELSTLTSTFYLDGLARSVNDGIRETRHSYDGSGAVAKLIEREGSTTVATTEWTHSDSGLQASTDSSRFASEFTQSYDAVGRPTIGTNAAGQATTKTWNADDTLASTELSDAPTLSKFVYSYDELGRILSRNRSGSVGAASMSYTYDAAGRVKTFAHATDVLTYAWDADGNRSDDGTGGVSFRADGSILQRSGQADAFEYDAAGRLTDDFCTGYAYDGFDRMTRSDPKPSSSACPTDDDDPTTYAYDGLDRQRSRIGGGTATFHHVGLASTIAAEDGATTTNYTVSADGRALAATSGSTEEFLDEDGFGHVATTTTSSDTVACSVAYDPWGDPRGGQSKANPCEGSGASASALFYSGARRDPATGDYQLGSRTYDPTKASFLSPDTYREQSSDAQLSVGVDPLTRNRYSYVNGDPVNLVDPTGHEGCLSNDQDACSYMYTADPKYRAGALRHLRSVRDERHFDRKFGECFEDLSCSLRDFERMTAGQRRIWLKKFDATFARRLSARGWFGAVDGILRFFDDEDLIRRSKFISITDAAILQGLQDGMARAIDLADDGQGRYQGAREWEAFFEAREERGRLSDEELVAMWSRAEQRNTTRGMRLASRRGVLPTQEEVELLVFSDYYRGVLRNPAKAAPLVGLSCAGLAIFDGPVESCAQSTQQSLELAFDPRNGEFTYQLASALWDAPGCLSSCLSFLAKVL